MRRRANYAAMLLLVAAAPRPHSRPEHPTSPVEWPVLRAFGSPGDGGPAAGLTYRTPAGAIVYSPCRGRVTFAAPFRSYGRLIILQCGASTDLVLAGLGNLAANPGQIVRVGQTLGRTGTRSGLYLELRRHGQPVDPAPFLTGHPSWGGLTRFKSRFRERCGILSTTRRTRPRTPA